MGIVDEATIGFSLFEDSVEFMGIVEANLPELVNIMQSVEGAGINGKYESPILGQIEPMTLSLSFRSATASAIKLAEPRRHNIDLRAAVQQQDPTKGIIKVAKATHSLVVVPKKLSIGKLATATTSGANGEYSVMYYAYYIDGLKMMEIDPLNYIYYINGQDNRWEEIKKALGKY